MRFLSPKILGLAAVLGLSATAVYLAVSVLFAPQLLFFPFHRVVGGVSFYAEAPIPDSASRVVQRSKQLLQASPLSEPGDTIPAVYLTDGGWRWSLLSLGAGGAFALTRPSTERIVVNRSDVETDYVRNGAGGERSLSGVIAHERTHSLIRRHFGLAADRIYPSWVREGYCDFVAGSSTLTDAQAADLRARNASPPALAYYDARRRVAANLGSNGGSVDDLFEGSRRSR